MSAALLDSSGKENSVVVAGQEGRGEFGLAAFFLALIKPPRIFPLILSFACPEPVDGSKVNGSDPTLFVIPAKAGI